MSKKDNLPTKAETEQFDMLYPMLVDLLDELRELSKKKQDGVLNTLKAKNINKILEKVRDLLAKEPTSEFLELLDPETLPTNSDAVIIVVHFKSALEQYKRKYSAKDEHKYDYWTRPEWNTKD